MTEPGKVDVPIRVSPDLLDTFGEPEVRAVIQHLVQLFKGDYERLFPVDIDVVAFVFLRHLSAALKRLSACEGFTDHLKEFRNSVQSTYLVTVMADWLVEQGRDIALEPPVPGTGRRGDIRFSDPSGQVAYVECKSPRKEVLEAVREETEPMYEALRESVIRPCDIFVRYDEALDGEALDRLASFLRDRLPSVRTEGTILDTAGLKVDVTNVRDGFEDIGDVSLLMPVDNYAARSREPLHILNRGGVAIGFAKTNVSVLPSIERQFRASRGQAPEDAPLILTVQGDFMTGLLEENLRGIGRLFQPRKNTSVTGVVLAEWSYAPPKLIDRKFNIVSNPYARNPFETLGQLFHARDFE